MPAGSATLNDRNYWVNPRFPVRPGCPVRRNHHKLRTITLALHGGVLWPEARECRSTPVMMYEHLAVIGGRAHPELAREIAQYLGVDLGRVDLWNFPDGEIGVKILENIRGRDVFLVQPTSPSANENLMELLLLIDACKRASAARITAVMPYFGYARQDRKDSGRVPITAKLVADLISTAGADRVLTMDLHAAQIQGFFDVPVDHLYACPILDQYFLGLDIPASEMVIVSPDEGSIKRTL